MVYLSGGIFSEENLVTLALVEWLESGVWLSKHARVYWNRRAHFLEIQRQLQGIIHMTFATAKTGGVGVILSCSGFHVSHMFVWEWHTRMNLCVFSFFGRPDSFLIHLQWSFPSFPSKDSKGLMLLCTMISLLFLPVLSFEFLYLIFLFVSYIFWRPDGPL